MNVEQGLAIATPVEPSTPALRSISVVVPTYREAENIPILVRRIETVARQHRLDVEILIVDDESGDGTSEVVAGLGEEPLVRLVTRRGKRCLSRAVVEGLRLAERDVLVVMDADLSHPPEAIPLLLDALARPRVDFVLGSRYVEGGSTDESWTLFRGLQSLVAGLLARPFTRAHDPTSGLFALRRDRFLAAEPLDPVGYKIALELIVKCRCVNVYEVPIRFHRRLHGTSKLTMGERVRYLRHLARLWRHKLRQKRG